LKAKGLLLPSLLIVISWAPFGSGARPESEEEDEQDINPIAKNGIHKKRCTPSS
jgi:hypothetical protein